jgi:hypothetical protein
MRRRWLVFAPTVALVLALAVPSGEAASNSRVTVDNDGSNSYTRYDGASDTVTTRCSQDRRQQNEPAVAVDPHNTQVVTAGANDYCTVPNTGDVWAGYYRSTDGGTTWHDSLVPGYPGDTSAAGSTAPQSGSCAAAGDPTQMFDNDGRLFYGFICFNRGKPVNGGIYVARYLNDGANYDRTVLVKKGQPSAIFLGSGHFQDKGNLTVDQGAGSKFEGYVYMGWSQYNGKSGNNNVLVSRSTNHGASFQTPVKVTPTEQGTASFVDLNASPDGTLYITWLRYTTSFTGAVMLARSTDGGQTFGRARQIAAIDLFDSNQYSGDPGTYDCGDDPFNCSTGFTFSRFFSNSAVEADGTGVHVVWASDGAGGQSRVYVRNSPNGVNFGPASRIDPRPTGHQWFPDISSANGTINVIYYDSREDPAYSPSNPPGNTAAGSNSGDVVNAFLAKSTNGGGSWSSTQLSSHGSNFGWETHGARKIGFWGDYLYVSAVPGAVNATWTDSRDLVPGCDPREGACDDDQDGFDVLQQPCPDPVSSSDPCLDTGGLDQNIYASRE